MRKIVLFILFFGPPFFLKAQFVVTSSGNWNDPASWQSGAIASGPTAGVSMNTTTTITVIPGDTETSGTVDAPGDHNEITVGSGGSLNIGDSGHPADLNAGQNMTIVANGGTIIIWGNVTITNSLAIQIQSGGQIIIKGNLNIDDFANFSVSGDLEVDGAFTAGMSTNVIVNSGATISVFGPTSVGPSSNVIGGGQFHTYGGCSGPSSFCSTLPITLTFFRAQPVDKEVNLTWATGTELNFDYFIVERSLDGRNFQSISKVQGQGTTTSTTNYSERDEKPVTGKSYYRLTEVDLDKSIHHLKIAEVTMTDIKSLSIYPNPVCNGQVNFELNFVPEANLTVSIIDLRGNIVSQFTIQQQSLTLPVQLPSGMYVVSLRSSSLNTVSKLLVK